MHEQIRAWTELTETFVLEVIQGQRVGKRAALARMGALVEYSKSYAQSIS